MKPRSDTRPGRAGTGGLVIGLTLALAIVAVGTGLIENDQTVKAAVAQVAGLGLLAWALVRGRDAAAPPWRPLDWAMLAWLGVEALTALTSRAPWFSVFGELEQHDGLLTSAALFGAYLAARRALAEPRAARRAIDVWFAGAAIASVVALLQAAGVLDTSGAVVATYGGIVRPFGTLGHPNLLGAITAPAAAMALARALREPRARMRNAAACALFTVATAITFSRGSWLALPAGVVVGVSLALAAGGVRPRLTRRALLFGAVAVVALVAVAVATGWSDLIAARLRELVSPTAGSSRSRLEIWRTAVTMWRDRPLEGQGPDTFGMLFTRFQSPDYWRFEWGRSSLHAHSTYLHVLATRGLLGFVAGTAVVVALVAAMRARWRAGGEGRDVVVALAAALAAFAVAGAFDARGIAGALAVTVLLAIAPPAAAVAPAPRARAAVAAGIAVALAAATFAVTRMSASAMDAEALLFVHGAGGARPQALATAAELASQAGRTSPWDDHAPRIAATAWLQSAADVTDALAQAESAAREAVRRAPARAVNRLLLADVLLARRSAGDPVVPAAIDSAYAAAAAAAPANVYAWIAWSRARLALGDTRGAGEPAQRAAALYPEAASAWVAVAEAAAAAGDSVAAGAALDRASAGEWHDDRDAERRGARLARTLGLAR